MRSTAVSLLYGGLYGSMETTTLFAGTAAILLVFGGMLVVAVPWLKRKMA